VIAQYLVNGLVTGSIYALMALGLAIIFGLMNIINFAHGSIYVLGAYLGYTLAEITHGGFVAALLGAAVGAAAFGALIERTLLSGASRTSDVMMPMLVTIGLWFAIDNAIIIVWGAHVRTMPELVGTGSWNLGLVRVQPQQLVIAIIALAVIVLTQLWLSRSRTGVSLRAAFQERDAAWLCGINVRSAYTKAFALGAALAGLGGTLVASMFALSPSMGQLATAQAFAIVILGGLGSFSGTILAALAIGLAESLTAGYLSAGYAPAVSLILLMVILNVRPQGLMGRRVQVSA
jgi:branched-chain amino acid transport system permease protein